MAHALEALVNVVVDQLLELRCAPAPAALLPPLAPRRYVVSEEQRQQIRQVVVRAQHRLPAPRRNSVTTHVLPFTLFLPSCLCPNVCINMQRIERSPRRPCSNNSSKWMLLAMLLQLITPCCKKRSCRNLNSSVKQC